MPDDKIAAYMTLYTALVTLSKVSAPLVPFITDEIYRNLVCSVDKSAPISVHLCDYPVADESMIDASLEENMDKIVEIVVLGRATRNQASIKNRQPIGKMYVKADKTPDEGFVEIIRDELNVKAVEFTDNVSAFTSYTFKPQLRTVGPKYGKFLGGIRNYLATVDGNAAMDELNANGAIKFVVNGEEIALTNEDLLIDMAKKEGFESLSDRGVTVVLDTNLTEELLEEGMVRELVSKIQNMRKDSGFEVMDHIVITAGGSERVCDILRRNAEEICTQTLADNVVYADGGKEWNINGETVSLAVAKV